jgi:hypothetical protein
MGKVLPKYKSAVAENFISAISSNSAQYYAFAANPVEQTDGVPTETLDRYNAYFTNNWKMLFGVKLANTDVSPVTAYNAWESNTVYDRYDNTRDMSNTSYYVVTPPTEPGGSYHVFKCIDNANGEVSTEKPDQVQAATFSKSDGYKWRYIYSITAANFTKFGTDDYVPIIANSTIVSGAYNYAGVEVVPIVDGGSGYDAYHDGTIRSVANSTCLQIENTAAAITNYYQNNAIYLTNNNSPTAQLFPIANSVANSSGNWVILTGEANTSIITPGVTQYKISPRVVFNTDGDEDPKAYTVVSNTANSISEIVVIDTGYGISRAEASIVTSIVSPVSNVANVYCIVPSPGGHGANPESEVNVRGYVVAIQFSGSEANTIPTNVLYNRIGLIKDPHILNANNTKGASFTSNSFSAVLEANVSGHTYLVGETITGETSGAKGVVAFANSSKLHLVGDKNFEAETIVNEDGDTATITINTLGDIYTKDLVPMYYRNITDISRSASQVESFKLIIGVE